jgi:membrane protein DedA with SNARE-associated domain
LLFILVWLAAVGGDTTGFILGRKLGRQFLLQHGPRFRITPEIVARVEGIFDKHGGKAIILGRFIGVARAITPFLAGSSHLPLRRFLAFDIPGAGAWAATFLGVGYLLAASASGAASLSHNIGLAIGTAAVAGAIALGIRHVSRNAPRGARLRFALRWLRAALRPGNDAKRP